MNLEKNLSTDLRADSLLVELANEALENWNSTEMERRRILWAEHFNCKKQSKIPVKCAIYDSHDLVWRQLLREDDIVHKQGLKRDLEIQLRIKLEKFRRFHDDDVILPVLRLELDRGRAPDGLWGVPLSYDHSDFEGGAVRPVPPLKSEEDLKLLRMPEVVPMDQGEARLRTLAAALTAGRLEISIRNDELHYGPYEWAVRLRGAENLLFDAYDRPEWLHELMDRITTGMVAYHRSREKSGMVDFLTDLPRVHVPYDKTESALAGRLAGQWAYVHAQSSASMGPAMYEEFVHPYNSRIAELFGRVYYHGCENLGRKASVIAQLPNLRYFHVSPWTRLSDIVPITAGRNIVLEVHSHPTEVLFCQDTEQIRRGIKRLKEEAEGQVFDFKLCDVETISGAEGKLETWTEIAMEESIL